MESRGRQRVVGVVLGLALYAFLIAIKTPVWLQVLALVVWYVVWLVYLHGVNKRRSQRYPRLTPKTPKELKEQADERNEGRPADDHSLTAEGLKVPNPSRDHFFSKLEKVSKPDEQLLGYLSERLCRVN